MAEPVYIYGLCDPGTDRVRYVGKSDDPAQRLLEHLAEAANPETKSRKATWLRSLGAPPNLLILETTDEEHWVEREKTWIQKLRPQLVNGEHWGRGHLRSKERLKSVIVYLPPADHLAVQDEARAQMSSASVVVRGLVRRWVDGRTTPTGEMS